MCCSGSSFYSLNSDCFVKKVFFYKSCAFCLDNYLIFSQFSPFITETILSLFKYYQEAFRKVLQIIKFFFISHQTKGDEFPQSHRKKALVMFCAIWYHLYNLKNVKNTHGGVLLFNFAKSNTLPWSIGVFRVFKLNKCTKLRSASQLLVDICKNKPFNNSFLVFSKLFHTRLKIFQIKQP